MNVNEPSPSAAAPTTPASGADAWKNKPTSCWPTPANMAAAREFSSALDPNYGSDVDRSNDETTSGDRPIDRESDALPEPDQAAADDDAEDAWAGEGGAEEDDDVRPSLAADHEVPTRFRDTVARLDDVSQRPVAEHAESYDAVHRDLRQALDDVER